jgi:hypothetical protein
MGASVCAGIRNLLLRMTAMVNIKINRSKAIARVVA